jgi:formiminotetrahydrofolate cyclodeaminase
MKDEGLMTQPSFSTMALTDLLDAFASGDPTPGGGSAAALTASLGVSLLLMVASMAKTRTGAPEEIADLAAAAARLRPLREELIALIESDSAAYVAVISALRLPKDTEAAVSARRRSVEDAMRQATEIPLQTMRLCEQALRDAPVVVRFGNRNALTDAQVAARLLVAALESAGLNVVANLVGLKDSAYGSASAEEGSALQASARHFAEQVERAMPARSS